MEKKFTDIYEKIGYSINYVDMHNKEFRDYQIDWIWNNPNYNEEANCDTIKGWDMCLKHKCRRYRRCQG